MAKLKKKKGLKDVTGDGKFTYADVLKMRGVKPKKSMSVGGRLNPMRPFYVGNPANTNKDVRLTDDYLDRIDDVYGPYTGAYRRIDPQSRLFRSIDIVANPDKEKAMADREIMAHGGKVKLLRDGGTVEYGLGGAIMAGINAIKNKEGLVGGIKNVAKAYATPGSGFAQGAKLAGGMLANANNPALAGIGKVAGMASNFMPGGGGVAGMMPALQGLFSQKQGGMVPVKLKYASGGLAIPEGEKGGEGEIPGLDVKSQPVMVGFDVEAQKPIMDKATQIYIDGLPVSGREAAAFINEKSEGMEGQGGVSVPDALRNAQLRRIRERHGRDYLGQGMYRLTAEEELLRDQKAAGAKALLKRLNEYDGGNVRRTRSY